MTEKAGIAAFTGFPRLAGLSEGPLICLFLTD